MQPMIFGHVEAIAMSSDAEYSRYVKWCSSIGVQAATLKSWRQASSTVPSRWAGLKDRCFIGAYAGPGSDEY